MSETIALNSKSKPFILEIEVKPKTGAQKALERIGLFGKVKRLEVHDLSLGTVAQIGSILLKIEVDADSFKADRVVAEGPAIVERHHDALCSIVAMAVKNYSGKYDASCKRLIAEQLTTEDILKAMIIVRSKMYVEHFLGAIAMLKGVEILDTKNNSL